MSAQPGDSVRVEPFAFPLPESSGTVLARRAARTAAAAVTHFTRIGVQRARGLPVPDTDVAHALRAMFEDLGATYLKLGQLMGSAPGVFGDVFAAVFRSCLDTGPPVAFEEVHRSIEIDLGARLEDVFASFEREPLGAASIAVVHRARTRSGRDVAVKVLRPDIDRLVAADLDLMEPLVALLARGGGLAIADTLEGVLGNLRGQISEELDLRNEMRAMARHRRLVDTIEAPAIVVPEPVPELCGRTVLTMEYLDGVPIDDFTRIAELGVDPTPLLEQLLKAWFTTALRDGVFHGDVHAGNLLLLRDGRLGVLDWGIVGRLDADAHHFFRRVVEGALGDVEAWDDVATHVAQQYYGGDVQALLGVDDSAFQTFVRGRLEPLLTQPLGELSLADLINSPEAALASRNRDGDRPRGRTREALAQWRSTRRRRRFQQDTGAVGSGFDRGTFLLGKQLLYFEHYGKLYLPDRSILADRAFLQKVLGEEPEGS